MSVNAPGDAGRRVLSRWTGRLRSLPILALHVHTACNCRCVMCDIWKANAARREIDVETLNRHVDAIRGLRVQRVMLTGGEPLLHGNLWALCGRLRESGIRLSLVTTGLLIDRHVEEIARSIDDLVVSIDGPPAIHDAIRRIPGGFERVARGVAAVRRQPGSPSITARSVVQRANHTALADAVRAIGDMGVDRLSFLAADVSSLAFNRPEPWSPERQAEVAVARDELPALAHAIAEVEARHSAALARGFVAGGAASLWRIHDYYRALAGAGTFPAVRCNAPWVSAVLEPDGAVRPCFFHPAYGVANGETLAGVLNSSPAVRFRRELRVETNETCRRCVCSLALPWWASA